MIDFIAAVTFLALYTWATYHALTTKDGRTKFVKKEVI
jgi:hypothetical protein